MSGRTGETPRRAYGLAEGEHLAWSVMATLIAGPLLYGAVGAGIDSLAGTSRVFLALGVLLGLVSSFYIVYARFGRD
jgi:F0F1-type ATP synthase assembly protein I